MATKTFHLWLHGSKEDTYAQVTDAEQQESFDADALTEDEVERTGAIYCGYEVKLTYIVDPEDNARPQLIAVDDIPLRMEAFES